MVTRFFYDTEFVVHNGFPHLLSIGVVPENDDAPDLYVSRDLDELVEVAGIYEFIPVRSLAEQDPFVDQHVLPYLQQDGDGDPQTLKRIGEIAASYIRGIADGDDVQLWGDTPAYDHVVLASCFGGGKFEKYPHELLPLGTFDIQQEIARVELPHTLRIASTVPHRALEDAIAARDQFVLVQVYDVLTRLLGQDRMRSAVAACYDSSDYREHLRTQGLERDGDALMRMVAAFVGEDIPCGGSMGELIQAFGDFVNVWAPGKVRSSSGFDRAVSACTLVAARDTFAFLARAGRDAPFANTWGITECSCCADPQE